jgi:hypothetical protein
LTNQILLNRCQIHFDNDVIEITIASIRQIFKTEDGVADLEDEEISPSTGKSF